jgi:hypothetical protein
VAELAKVLTPENRAEVLPRFFHASKQEAKAVAAEIRPAEVVPRKELVTAVPAPLPPPSPSVSSSGAGRVHPGERQRTHPEGRSEVAEPLTPALSRLHMTVSRRFLEKLEAARKGQGHAQPGASAEQVIEAALDLLLAQQARRRAEVGKPQRDPRPARTTGHVPAAVKRAVWARDDGKCQWRLDSGGTCGSTLRLEIDHVVPRARGGPSSVENCRLICRLHNDLAARQVYGDDWMDRFTLGIPSAREPATGYRSMRLAG